MNNKPVPPVKAVTHEVDLKRTERVDQQGEAFFWDGDALVQAGKDRTYMAKGLSELNPTLKASFKQHLISFTKQGDYAQNTYSTFFSVLRATLNLYPPSGFDATWMAQALTNPGFLRHKKVATRLFVYWQGRDSTVISHDALHLLDDTVAHRRGPRNVLSDDPEKSWLTDLEYEVLLSAVWANYDNRASSTQVTLIRLFSMQYARRPLQFAHLKVGDIRISNGSDSQGLTGRIADFPGIKDMTAETGFRDAGFEPHPLADHLWDLCEVQRQEVRILYEHTFGFSLTDDQLNKLPLFCSEKCIRKARQLIEVHYQLDLRENLDSEQFHLHRQQITKILRWELNTPTCAFGTKQLRQSSSLKRPKPPISLRTNEPLVVTATRMRHTRARQLARKGVPRSVLSHWLGHTEGRSLDAYYNDPAEQARELDEAMSPVLTPLAMAFAGTLIESENQATRASDPTSKLEFASAGQLKNVGFCGKHSFCTTSTVPVPCYRCKHFEPLVDAPHQEVHEALVKRQEAEKQTLKIGGLRNLLIPIDFSADIRAVENCIAHCNARLAERKIKA